MKKLVFLVVLVGLLLAVTGGTCMSGFLSSANTTTAAVANKVCNAPASVVEICDLVISLLKPVAISLVPASAPYVALVTAQGIKDTGCALSTDVNTMIAFIQSANTLQDAQAKVAKGINITPLQVWAGGKAISVAPLQEWAGIKK